MKAPPTQGSPAQGSPDGRHVLEALPVGIALYDSDRRLLFTNPAFGRILGVSPGVFRPLSTLAENVRLVAYRGLFGPGDPELQTRQIAVDNIGKERRFQRRHPDGRSFDSHHIPLPDGGHLICLIDSTAHTQLRDSTEHALARIAAAIAGLQLGLALFTPDRTLERHNPRFADLLGLPPAALADPVTFDTLTATLAAPNELWPGADLLGPTATTLRYTPGPILDLAAQPLPDGGWSLAVADITALATAESELARRTQLLADIVANIPHGVTVYGPDRRLTLVNDAYARIMAGAPIAIGDSIDEIIERRARSGEYGPGDLAELAQSRQAHDNTRPQFRRRRRPNGAVVDVRTAPLPGGNYLSVVTDVSALIAAETELARRTETLDPLLANIRHGIILWDKESRLIVANPLAATLLGTPEALLAPGRSLADVIGGELERGNFGDDPAAAAARAQALIEQDRTIPQRAQRATRAGRVIDVCSTPTPAGGFVTTFTDITEAHEIEEALRLSRAAAEAATAIKSRFLATLGAELRTPLHDILAETAALSRDAAATPAQPLTPARIATACNTVGKAATALLALLDAALDAASLEAEQFGLVDDQVDVPALLRSVLRRFEVQAIAAEVALVLEVPGTVPPVRADRRRLLQALSAVLANAIKMTRPLGSVSIGARHDWARGSVLLEISDTGPGLPPADIERAFEPFTQLDQPRAIRSGTGLGLYTSRLLMRAHGGDLTLRSRPGLGTTATLLLPATRVLRDPAEPLPK